MQLRATVAVVDTVDKEGQSPDSLIFATLREKNETTPG
jgi:hypothetical protein